MLKKIPMQVYKFHPLIKTEISRLITAAVINYNFRSNLLADPAHAIADGFYGEHFKLDKDQSQQITSIQASNLVEFATQLVKI